MASGGHAFTLTKTQNNKKKGIYRKKQNKNIENSLVKDKKNFFFIYEKFDFKRSLKLDKLNCSSERTATHLLRKCLPSTKSPLRCLSTQFYHA
jgi:hypothetical protein